MSLTQKSGGKCPYIDISWRYRGCNDHQPRSVLCNRNTDWRDAKVKPALDTAIQKMEALGAFICDPADLPSYKEWKTRMRLDQWEVIRHGLKEGLAGYLSGMQRTGVHTLRDIIE